MRRFHECIDRHYVLQNENGDSYGTAVLRRVFAEIDKTFDIEVCWLEMESDEFPDYLRFASPRRLAPEGALMWDYTLRGKEWTLEDRIQFPATLSPDRIAGLVKLITEAAGVLTIWLSCPECGSSFREVTDEIGKPRRYVHEDERKEDCLVPFLAGLVVDHGADDSVTGEVTVTVIHGGVRL